MTKIIAALAVFLCVTTAASAASTGGGEGDYLFSSIMGLETRDFLFKCFNFAILLYLLHRFARKPIVSILASVAKKTKETMDSSEIKLNDEKSKLAEYRRKIANIEEEIVEMQEQSSKAIEEEKRKAIAEAEETAKKIERQTQVRIEQDLLQAKMEVRAFLVQESAKLAERLIAEKIDGSEQKKLISAYTDAIKDVARI